jgi:uncharacterized membrane protein YphA (DoxX/SURF4 family)
MSERHVASSYWSLRIAFGVVPIVAGLDKFTNLLTDWSQYLSPLATRVLPISPTAFMHAVGIIEVVVGLAILAGWARIFGFVASAWLACIALNIITTGHFLDVAARDAVLAVGAYTLGRLAQLVEQPGVDRAAVQRPSGAHA